MKSNPTSIGAACFRAAACAAVALGSSLLTALPAASKAYETAGSARDWPAMLALYTDTWGKVAEERKPAAAQ